MEIASLTIAIVALLWTSFVYFRHEKKLKVQESIINTYQIEKIGEEKDSAKKAIIRINVISGGVKGEKVLKVYNMGKATAYNVDLKMDQEIEGLYNMSNPFPFDFLHPQESRSYSIMMVEESPDTLKVILTWKDEFQENNIFKHELYLRS